MLNKVKTKRFRRFLLKCPPWIFTVVVSVAILYLTLMPDPLPKDTPELFPGADKVVHALMFGGLTIVILLDRQRWLVRKTHRLPDANWPRLSPGFIFATALISSFAGIIIECLQYVMALGRGFEVTDIVADITGSFVFAILWLLFQFSI